MPDFHADFEPPATNEASWAAMIQFMAGLSRYPNLVDWSRVGRAVLEHGCALGLDRHFRAGQSMHHLIFSTVPHFGLEAEWRVTLAPSPPGEDGATVSGQIEVSLARANRWFSMPDDAETAPVAEAWPLVAEYLSRLWRATKADTPPPAGILTYPDRGL